MFFTGKHRHPSAVPAAYIFVAIFLVLGQCSRTVYGKPIEDSMYKDTEEIFNEWDNELNSLYSDSEEIYDDSSESVFPKVTYLPPVLVEYSTTTSPPTTTTTTTTTTTPKPVYFPRTDIEISPFIDQLNKARRQEIVGPVDLPVPYIVWSKDPSGNENRFNYWQRFYNTMYKVD